MGSIVAIVLMYFTIWLGLYLPLSLTNQTWLVIIMIYVFLLPPCRSSVCCNRATTLTLWNLG